MNVTTLGIDLAKAVFPLHGVDERGQGGSPGAALAPAVAAIVG